MTIEAFEDKSEDLIVATVLQGAKGDDLIHVCMPSSEGRVFTYGKKRLEVVFYDVNEFGTWLDNLDGKKELSLETSIVYKAARLYMQKITDERRTPMKYTLSTKNVFMRDWAEGPGTEIFNWSFKDVIPQKNVATTYIFKTTISPTEEAQVTPSPQ